MTSGISLKMVRDVCYQESNAILKLLKKFKRLTFTEVMNYTGRELKDSGQLSYHLRKLRDGGFIRHDNVSHYTITKRGIAILKMVDMMVGEKFITENPEEICQNSVGSYEHVFVQICKHCAYIKKKEDMMIQMEMKHL